MMAFFFLFIGELFVEYAEAAVQQGSDQVIKVRSVPSHESLETPPVLRTSPALRKSRTRPQVSRTKRISPSSVKRSHPKKKKRNVQRYYIKRFVEEAAAKYHIEPALLHAVIWAESAFNHKAVSRVGARGLMQLMPKTAKSLGEGRALDFRFPKKNIMAGAKYLREQINAFQGDVRLALAAYNAGPTAVRKYKGIPPYKETREYVRKIMKRVAVERKRWISAN